MQAYKIYYNGKEFVVSDQKEQVQSVPTEGLTSYCEDFEKALKLATKKNALLTKSAEAYSKKSTLILVRQCSKCGEYFRVEGKKTVLRMPKECNSCTHVKHGCFFDSFDSSI